MSQTEKYYSGRSLLLPAQEDAAPESAVLHRCLKSLPHIVESAYGSYLTLDSDESILDACCGAVVACIGHGNTEVRDAAFAQWDKLAYAHTMQYRTKAAEDLGRCILEPHPSSPNFDPGLRKAFFVCSGSEANDSGMKCAKQYFHEKGESQRRFFISRRQAYHGGTIGAMSISSMPARKVPYDGIFMPNVVFVGAADAFHSKGKFESEADFVIRLVKEVEDVIEKVGAENIISFM
jgi:adenosylmethionine-8-amino-7-oxononanoate aminotransferase